MKLHGRVAVITGASSGVGYETARLLAREGAQVVAAARRRDKLEWLVGEIAGEGGRALAIPTDVTDSIQVTRLAESTHNLLGRVDILINSAGVVHKVAPVEQFSDDDFRSGRATVSRTLAILRAAYTPLPGSPVLGGGDPRDGDGNFIGAIGDGTLADDQFGRFAGGTP